MNEPFADKMARLTRQLEEQMAEGERLNGKIRRMFGGVSVDEKSAVRRD